MAKRSDRNGYEVPAVANAISAIAYLATPAGADSSMSEIARAVRLSKSTATNLLRTLERHGYVQRTPRSRAFRLGPALIALGAAAGRQAWYAEAAIQELTRFAGESGLSVALAQPTPDWHTQVIFRLQPGRGVHVAVALGERFKPTTGALGKCALAWQPREIQERLIAEHGLESFTDRTITDRAAYLRELEQVKRQGWAASRQEYNENNAVAAPIFDADSRVALICLTLGFLSELPDDDLPAVGARLMEVCERATHEIAGRSPEGAFEGASKATNAVPASTAQTSRKGS